MIKSAALPDPLTTTTGVLCSAASFAVRKVPGPPSSTTDTTGTSKSVGRKERKRGQLIGLRETTTCVLCSNASFVMRRVPGPPSSTTDTTGTSKSVEQKKGK